MSVTDNILLQTSAYLARQLQADPRLALAITTAWLDPLWCVSEADWDIPEDNETMLMVALFVLRPLFPDIYVQALESMRSGDGYHTTERLICAALYDLGIPLDDLQWMAWGIPMPAYGTTLTNPDFYEAQPDLVPILKLFGIQPDNDETFIHVPDSACVAGRIVADSLEAEDAPPYRQLAWLLQWLFGWSGNTCIDLDYDALAEIELPCWDKAGVELAQAVITEADDIVKQAQEGLAWLKGQSTVSQALHQNVRRTLKLLERKGGTNDNLTIRLRWPRLINGADGAAELVA